MALAVCELTEALETLDLGSKPSDLAARRDHLLGVLSSYAIPRLSRPDTPMRVVFAGPTGSGKSTLVNSLSGLHVSDTGALRPTTKGPVLLAAERSAPVLSEIGGVTCHVVFGEAPILESMSLVDTPDIDSTETGHRAMAETLVDNADVVVFVTSVLRYADEVPWEVLRRAISRGTPVINVLNRVSSATSGAIVDFKARLASAGLDPDFVVVAEHHAARDRHRVPPLAVKTLAQRLEAIAVERSTDSGRLLRRVLDAVVGQVFELSADIESAVSGLERLEAELADHLNRRVPDLDFSGVGDAMYTRPPEEPRRGAMRNWRRVNRHDPGVVAEREKRLIEGMLAVIHADLRTWLSDDETAAGLHLEPASVIPQVLVVARSALEGWRFYVRRIVQSMIQRDRWLAEALLIDSATRDSALPAAQTAFGEETADVVERARRELDGRIEVVYGQFAARVVDPVAARMRSIDPRSLRMAASAVNVTLATTADA